MDFQVKALDDDESAAAALQYAITRVSPHQATDWFHIHPLHGALSTRTSLTNKGAYFSKRSLYSFLCC